MKHQEHIFAVPANIIPKADETNLVPFTVEGGDVVIAQRAGLEVNPNYRQILPYILVECNGKLFTYQRTKGIGEDRLLGKHSVGLGGHIDLSDIDFDATAGALNWTQTYARAAMRELAEEMVPSSGAASTVGGQITLPWAQYNGVGYGEWVLSDYIPALDSPYSPTLKDALKTFSIEMQSKIAAEGGVEAVHLGCPILISIPTEEWTTAEEELVFKGFHIPEEILEQFDCERWTEILLEDYLRCREENGGELSFTDWFAKR